MHNTHENTFDSNNKNNKVKVFWYYQKEDLDMKSSGARFAKLIKVDIDLKEY